MQHHFVNGATLALALFALASTGCGSADSDADAASGASTGMWTGLSFEQALQRAQRDDAILMVYATASWCMPCRQMEQTTWRDSSVAEWIENHGIALKLDVDENNSLARQLRIQAMPTMIAYRGNEQFDRVMGYQSAEELTAWLEGVRQGHRAIDRLREASARVDEHGRVNIETRYELASMLTQNGEFDEAAEEYLWLWDNMLDHDPAMSGVRRSFMISEMQQLANLHQPAMEAFRQRRFEYEPGVREGTASADDVGDWLVLARVVNDEESALTWFDNIKNEPIDPSHLRMGQMVLLPMLIERGRWADVTLLYPDPLAELNQAISMTLEREPDAQMDAEHRRQVDLAMREFVHHRAAILYAAFLASGDDETAMSIADLMFEHDAAIEAKLALIAAALHASQPRAYHLQWLNASGDRSEEVAYLRDALNEALAGTNSD